MGRPPPLAQRERPKTSADRFARVSAQLGLPRGIWPPSSLVLRFSLTCGWAARPIAHEIRNAGPTLVETELARRGASTPDPQRFNHP